MLFGSAAAHLVLDQAIDRTLDRVGSLPPAVNVPPVHMAGLSATRSSPTLPILKAER